MTRQQLLLLGLALLVVTFFVGLLTDKEGVAFFAGMGAILLFVTLVEEAGGE